MVSEIKLNEENSCRVSDLQFPVDEHVFQLELCFEVNHPGQVQVECDFLLFPCDQWDPVFKAGKNQERLSLFKNIGARPPAAPASDLIEEETGVVPAGRSFRSSVPRFDLESLPRWKRFDVGPWTFSPADNGPTPNRPTGQGRRIQRPSANR